MRNVMRNKIKITQCRTNGNGYWLKKTYDSINALKIK